MKTLRHLFVISLLYSILIACEAEEDITPYKLNEAAVPFNLEGQKVLPESKNGNHTFVELNWDKSINPNSSFVVERSIGDDTKWLEIAKLENGINSYRDIEVLDEAEYFYRIKVIDSENNFNFSQTVNFFNKVDIFYAPSNLTARFSSTNSTNYSTNTTTISYNLPPNDLKIMLNWEDNSFKENGFIIEKSNDGNNWVELKKVGANITSYEDLEVNAVNYYYYRVSAFKYNFNDINKIEITNSSNIVHAYYSVYSYPTTYTSSL